jgi:hypothetical protein
LRVLSAETIVSEIDTSPALLAQARRRCPNLSAGGRLYWMDVAALEFPTASSQQDLQVEPARLNRGPDHGCPPSEAAHGKKKSRSKVVFGTLHPA